MTSANAGQPSERRLHEMLDLPEDAAVRDLRSAYERAMNEALSRGDNKRALALSKAFDNLPKRSAVYSAAGEPPIAPRPVYTPEPFRVRRARGGASRNRAPRAPRMPRGRRALRSIVSVALIGLVVASVIGLMIHFHVGPSTPDSNPFPNEPRYTQPRIPNARTVAPAITGPMRRIPADTPVDPQGLVRVSCPATASGAAYVQRARPGMVVSCSNGAVPRIAG